MIHERKKVSRTRSRPPADQVDRCHTGQRVRALLDHVVEDGEGPVDLAGLAAGLAQGDTFVLHCH